MKILNWRHYLGVVCRPNAHPAISEKMTLTIIPTTSLGFWSLALCWLWFPGLSFSSHLLLSCVVRFGGIKYAFVPTPCNIWVSSFTIAIKVLYAGIKRKCCSAWWYLRNGDGKIRSSSAASASQEIQSQLGSYETHLKKQKYSLM